MDVTVKTARKSVLRKPPGLITHFKPCVKWVKEAWTCPRSAARPPHAPSICQSFWPPGRRNGGIYIPCHQDHIRLLDDAYLIESKHYCRGLPGVTAGAQFLIVVRPGNIQPVKDRSGHFPVIVLTCMHQQGLAITDLNNSG